MKSVIEIFQLLGGACVICSLAYVCLFVVCPLLVGYAKKRNAKRRELAEIKKHEAWKRRVHYCDVCTFPGRNEVDKWNEFNRRMK